MVVIVRTTVSHFLASNAINHFVFSQSQDRDPPTDSAAAEARGSTSTSTETCAVVGDDCVVLPCPLRCYTALSAPIRSMWCSASFMRRKGAQVLVAALGRFGTGDSKDAAVTKEACYAVRAVTMGDDRRKDFSCKPLHLYKSLHVNLGAGPKHYCVGTSGVGPFFATSLDASPLRASTTTRWMP